jgi:hypothetical protein
MGHMPCEMHTHEMHAHKVQAHETHACEIHAHEMRAHKVQAHETHVYEVYAHEMYTHEMHAYERQACTIHTHEIHAYEVYPYEIHTREIYAHRSMAFWGYGAAELMCLRSPATMTSTRFKDNEHPQPHRGQNAAILLNRTYVFAAFGTLSLGPSVHHTNPVTKTMEMKLNDYPIRRHERKADGRQGIFDYSKKTVYEMS